MKKAISLFLIFCISTVLLSACSPSIPTSDQYVEGYDLQSTFGYAPEFRMCASDDSYYYLAPTGTIYLIDKQTLNCVPFCSKPNCKHDNAQCTARTRSQGLWMYQGALYVSEPRENTTTETNELESYTLYKISLDGSNKDEVRHVGMSIMGGFIHRGYYYANDFDGVRRYSLTDKEENELILKRTDEQDYMIRTSHGNSIYINTTRNNTQPVIEVFRYNLSDLSAPPISVGQIEVREDGEFNELMPVHISDEGILALNGVSANNQTTVQEFSFFWLDKNGKEKERLDLPKTDINSSGLCGSITADDSCYYRFIFPAFQAKKEDMEKSILHIYDRKTNQLIEKCTFYQEYGAFYSIFTGDERYLFMEFEQRYHYSENGERVNESDPYRTLCVLDKQQIGKGAELQELLHLTK